MPLLVCPRTPILPPNYTCIRLKLSVAPNHPSWPIIVRRAQALDVRQQHAEEKDVLIHDLEQKCLALKKELNATARRLKVVQQQRRRDMPRDPTFDRMMKLMQDESMQMRSQNIKLKNTLKKQAEEHSRAKQRIKQLSADMQSNVAQVRSVHTHAW